MDGHSVFQRRTAVMCRRAGLTLTRAGVWEEGKHPRDPHGRFAHVPGVGLVDKTTGALASLTDTQYTAHTQAVERRVADALARGLAHRRHPCDRRGPGRLETGTGPAA